MNYRAALVRNILVAGTNGTITLIILLIAPLGLAAVIMNTALVTVASFLSGQAADRVVGFLQKAPPASDLSVEVLSDPDKIQRRN
ncbi:MAG: CRISPR-associated protein Csx18 [Prochlorotrichaceae cyanobacterium]|jgi:hypothetical protein